jgi:hypothetical protein
MKFILCLILVAGVSAGINEQIRFKGLLRTSQASKQVATAKDLRSTKEVKKRGVCKALVKGLLSKGSKSKGGKFICTTPVIKKLLQETIADQLKEAKNNIADLIASLKANSIQTQVDDAKIKMKEFTGPFFKFCGASEQIIQNIGNGASKVADAFVAVPEAAYQGTVEIAETFIEDKFKIVEDKTHTCKSTLDTVNELFVMLVDMPSYVKILLAPLYLTKLKSRDSAKAFLADAMCCQAGTFGSPESWCPKK